MQDRSSPLGFDPQYQGNPVARMHPQSKRGSQSPGERSAEHSQSDAAETGGLFPPYVVVACAAIFFWSISMRFVIYNLMPALAADLALSGSMAGILTSSLLLGYTGGSWASGWLPGSRKGRILWGSILSLPAVVAMSFSRELWQLSAAALITGFGVGIYLPLGVALIVEAGGRGKRARYLSFQEVSAALASFGGSAFVAAILFVTDWHTALLMWTVVGVAAVLIFSRVRDEGETGRARGVGHPVPLSLTLVSSVFTYAAATILLAGLIAVLPLIMVRAWDVELSSAASVIGYTRLAGLAGVLISGLRADLWGHRRTLLGFQLLALAGTIAMLVSGYGTAFVLGLVAVAAGASGGIVVLPLVIASAFSPQQRERALAASSGIGGLLGMVISPTLFGVMMDVGMVTGPILVAALATLGAIFATGRIQREGQGAGG